MTSNKERRQEEAAKEVEDGEKLLHEDHSRVRGKLASVCKSNEDLKYVIFSFDKQIEKYKLELVRH